MQRNFWKSASLILVGFALVACGSAPRDPLPLLGPYKVSDHVVDGSLKTDTVYTSIKPFSFIDQEGQTITNESVQGKVYVADFFFTSCPTICPKMKQQMLRMHGELMQRGIGEDRVVFLSHSIDPERDSVGRLKEFADKLGVASDRWHLMTGDVDSIYSMARHYMVAAQVDPDAPGGFAHSGAFILVDGNQQIRGVYDGVSPDEVDVLIDDIEFLLSEGDAGNQ